MEHMNLTTRSLRSLEAQRPQRKNQIPSRVESLGSCGYRADLVAAAKLEVRLGKELFMHEPLQTSLFCHLTKKGCGLFISNSSRNY